MVDDWQPLGRPDFPSKAPDLPVPFLPRVTLADKNDAINLMMALMVYRDECMARYGSDSLFAADLLSLLDAVTLEARRLQELESNEKEDDYNGTH